MVDGPPTSVSGNLPTIPIRTNQQRGEQTKKNKIGKSTHLGLRHPSHLATPHILSVLIVSPKDLSPEITTMSIPPGRLVLPPLKLFYPVTRVVPPLQVKSTSLSLLSGTRPLGQWSSQVNCRVGPHRRHLAREAAGLFLPTRSSILGNS